MRFSDIIGEHNVVPNQTFPPPTLNNITPIGKISIKNGDVLDIYEKNGHNTTQIIAVSSNKILGFVTFVYVPHRQNLVMAKNAQSYISGQNLLLNLFIFIKKQYNLRILSDIDMSLAGEAAWKSIVNNPRINGKIYNFDNDKIYDLTDPNAIKPENDKNQNSESSNWFYIIEAKEKSNKFGDTLSYNKLLLPYYYD